MTLTEAAYWTRRLGLVGGILFFLFVAISVVIVIMDSVNPPDLSVLTPDFACTAMPDEFKKEQLVVPSLQMGSGQLQYIEIDTLTGKTEQLPPVANVYRYNHPAPSLSAENKAKSIGEKLGFDPDAIRRRGTIQFYWPEDAYGRSLTVDANTLNYELKVNYKNSSALPKEKDLPTNEEAKNIARTFLSSNGWLLSDYGKEEPLFTLINIEPDGTFSMAATRSEAELIRVDFVRDAAFLKVPENIEQFEKIKSDLERNYEGYESEMEEVSFNGTSVNTYNFMTVVVNPELEKSNISVYVGTEYSRKGEFDAPDEIYNVEYTAWEIQQDPCGKYPLKSTAQIADSIENGEASLVYLNDEDGDTVIPYRPRVATDLRITSVVLGYLDSPERQEYLQPIYIVKGTAIMENGSNGVFYYYIPAIDYEILEPSTSPEMSGT